MRKANDEENQSAFDAVQQKMNALDKKIKRTEAIIQTKENVGNALPKESGKSPEAKDCLHAFCEALRAQVRQDIMAFNENRTIVNADLNETRPAEGGLLVPANIRTRINELRRTLNPLSKFFNVENVSALTGTGSVPLEEFIKIWLLRVNVNLPVIVRDLTAAEDKICVLYIP